MMISRLFWLNIDLRLRNTNRLEKNRHEKEVDSSEEIKNPPNGGFLIE